MKRTFVLAKSERADTAVRKILLALVDVLLSNVDGVLADDDIESLHDLRVANRRTRTALSQIKGVLSQPAVERFSPEFQWLGMITGPCRDLDVALLEIDIFREQIGIEKSALGPLRQFLVTKRRAEFQHLSTTLQSRRIQRLFEDWGAFLSSTTQEGTEPPFSSTPIIEIAGPRILKAVRRIRRRGTGIGSDASAALLHRLRIDGKKLRYLLEFFSDLYRPATIARCINELKRLQDILGAYNDTGVQLALIGQFKDLDHPSSVQPATTGRLTDAITGHRSELRTEAVERFKHFASEDSRRLYRKTFKNL